MFIVEGTDAVEPMDELEARLAARIQLAEHERYACCARITGVVTVTTSYWCPWTELPVQLAAFAPMRLDFETSRRLTL
jgi:hypothetical protein